eukprot:CAMPEP_0198458230 /NCGR_PEP_ID=MMETSP1453-20131121/34313_1 /TAXON_ID=1461543 ORGANISM="Unidentified sp., Strain RCC701" /NCGR_SAMPLE_ID=MMETSP1453 /ASSEMBLY_ACC=CAM_ASM_001118 /LENGTH=40 /DNA_ID= /DNA_START= /DNA_END= /DNA_ORIENTATION=
MDVLESLERLDEADPFRKKVMEAVARTRRAVALYGDELAL